MYSTAQSIDLCINHSSESCTSATQLINCLLLQQVYVYRPGSGTNFEWEISGDTIRNPVTDQCLAARGKYMPPVSGVAGIQLWAKPLGKGRTAALFINGGGANYTGSITLKELNVSSTAQVKVTAAQSRGIVRRCG